MYNNWLRRNQTLDAYQNQDYGQAETLAIQAYLDNYEFLEPALAEHDHGLMTTTEAMLREELRQLIMDRVPFAEIQEKIDTINENLDRAEELLQ